MEDIEKYESVLAIEEDSIDIACKQQAELFRMVGKNHVEAIDIRNRINNELEKLTAMKDEYIRAKAISTGEKLTENAIKNRIICDKEVIKKNDQLLLAQREVNDWGNLKDSYIQRANMLEEMGNYIRSNMFGEFTINTSIRNVEKVKYKELRNKKANKYNKNKTE